MMRSGIVTRVTMMMSILIGTIGGPLASVPVAQAVTDTTNDSSAATQTIEAAASSQVFSDDAAASSSAADSTTETTTADSASSTSASSESASTTSTTASSNVSSASSASASSTTKTTKDAAADDDSNIASDKIGGVAWYINSAGELHLEAGDFGSGLTVYQNGNASPWAASWSTNYASQIKKVVFDGEVTVSSNTSLKNLFTGLTSLTSIENLNLLKTDNVTSLQAMFSGDTALTTVDFTQNNFSSVTDMSNMFLNCKSLTALPTSNWQVGNVTTMSGMFNGCAALATLDVASWDVSKVTDFSSMFASCSQLTSLALGSWNVSQATTMLSMFQGCTNLTTIGATNDWQTGRVENMGSMFRSCTSLTTIALANWDVRQVTTMYSMFYGATGLTSLPVDSWQTDSLTNTGSMFANAKGLSTLNIKNFKMGKVTSMTAMFQGCTGLTTLDIGGWDVSKAESLANVFSGCSGLTSLDINSWSTSQVDSLSNAFYGVGLTTLDLSNWDVSKVTIFSNAFATSKIKQLNLSGWQTTAGKTMNAIFYNMPNLADLDISNFSTASATTYVNMFGSDKNLAHVKLGSKFVFKDSTMALPTPSTTAPYTGKWQYGTDGPTYTAAELASDYDGATMAGDYYWAKQGTVNVEYVDEAGNELAATTTINGAIGDKYTTEAKSFEGYQLKATPANASGTYTDTPITVTYEYVGQLVLTGAPTTLDFGTHTISAENETYDLAAQDTPLEVKDTHASGSSWVLSAQLTSSFVGNTTGKALAASLYYQDSAGQQTPITSTGFTPIITHTTTSTDQVNVSKDWIGSGEGLKLSVPAGSARNDSYSATIEWNLADTVPNE